MKNLNAVVAMACLASAVSAGLSETDRRGLQQVRITDRRVPGKQHSEPLSATSVEALVRAEEKRQRKALKNQKPYA